MTLRSVVLAMVSLGLGCVGDPYGAGSGADAKPVEKVSAKPKFVAGNVDGDIPPAVAKHVEAAGEDTVLVYVGASWCEPCQRFHEAVEKGELDDRLPGVRFVEYDADRDSKRLTEAGYDGKLIPRFAVPAPDGRFGGEKIEGGTKGDGAVEHIMDRLQPLLANVKR